MKKRYITHFKPNKDPWNDFSATETLLSSMKLLFDWVHNTNETKGSLGGHGVTETATVCGANTGLILATSKWIFSSRV